MEAVLFWIFASLTVVSAVAVVTMRSAINSAMALVATFFFLAGIYVLLWAHTIAVLQVLVYAGAIMVLFLFVIMLLSVTEVRGRMGWSFTRMVGLAAAACLLAVLVLAIVRLPPQAVQPSIQSATQFGTLQQVGGLLYTRYLFPFEAVSLLLLASIVGAVVVAKSRI